MAKADAYRRAIEHSIVKAELSSSDEIKKLWLHIREQYEYLSKLDACINDDIPFSKLADYDLRRNRR
jgi:hypothetical protein